MSLYQNRHRLRSVAFIMIILMASSGIGMRELFDYLLSEANKSRSESSERKKGDVVPKQKLEKVDVCDLPMYSDATNDVGEGSGLCVERQCRLG